MGARQRTWAKNKRAWLRVALGSDCCRCGSIVDLQFDCILPTGNKHHKMGSVQRTSFYYRQFMAENLQLLCKTCHQRKTAQDVVLHSESLPFDYPVSPAPTASGIGQSGRATHDETSAATADQQDSVAR